MRGAGLAGVGYGLTQVLTLAVYVVLARLLEPVEFGVFAAGSILIGFVLVITEGGLMSAVIQRRDRVEQAASAATIASFANGLLFSLIALALAPLIGFVFDSSQVGSIAAVMSGTILHSIGSS